MRPLFVICGKARAGKTTIAEHFTAMVQKRGAEFTYGETSGVIVGLVAGELGVSVECVLADKELHRPRMIEIGNAMCGKDPAALARALFSVGHSVITGVRRLEELARIRQDFPGVLALWVERDVPLIPDNREIEPEHCDALIDNNGTLWDVDKAIRLGLSHLMIGEIAAKTKAGH